ncbi:hypothetical protein ACLKMY_21200 [Paraburkholderia mimosarum]|uniref:hypothetical protein n=1 Tax=Paraburkholderia mimosarum TaxID=312026 RepID=UPI0039C220F3
MVAEVKSLKEWIFRRAITRATAKCSPSRIPMSGDRLLRRDYFSTILSDFSEGDVLVDATSVDGVVGRAWVAAPNGSYGRGEYAAPVTIPFDRAALAKVEYTYYLRQYEFRECSSAILWLRLLGRSYRLTAWKEDFRQVVTTGRRWSDGGGWICCNG